MLDVLNAPDHVVALRVSGRVEEQVLGPGSWSRDRLGSRSSPDALDHRRAWKEGAAHYGHGLKVIVAEPSSDQWSRPLRAVQV
jgi:hypothetical protein